MNMHPFLNRIFRLSEADFSEVIERKIMEKKTLLRSLLDRCRSSSVLVVALGAVAIGCGDDEITGSSESGNAEFDGTYSLKIYVKNDAGAYELKKIGPMSAPRNSLADPGDGSYSTDVDSSSENVRQTDRHLDIEYATGGTSSIVDLRDMNLVSFLHQVRAQCSEEQLSPGTNVSKLGDPLLHTDCDDVLLTAENQICAADKLLEIADSVRPLEWLGGQLIVPAQSERDKFIARDLALNILAEVARLFNRPGKHNGASGNYDTCVNEYQDVLATPSLIQSASPGGAYAPGLFGVAAGEAVQYLNQGISAVPANSGALVVPRLELIAHLARTGIRMVREAVRDSVAADLSGAATFRSEGSLAGLRAAWGISNNVDGTYNGNRHALALLLGRLEYYKSFPSTAVVSDSSVSWTQPGFIAYQDLACHGFVGIRRGTGSGLSIGPSAAMSDLLEATPAGFADRWADTPARTPEQSLATQLFRDGGIAVAPADFAAIAPSALRAAVADQLMINAAEADGRVPTNTTELNTVRADYARVSSVVERLSDEDLTFGLAASGRTLRILGGSVTAGTGALGGVFAGRGRVALGSATNATGLISPLLVTLKLASVRGGLKLTELANSPLADLGFAAAASMCPEPVHSSLTGIPEYYSRAFQDPFAVVQTLQRVLKTLAATPNANSLQQVAKLGLAEAKDLVVGTITAQFAYSLDPANIWRVYVEPGVVESLGRDVATMSQDELQLFIGEGWAAECHAGVRKVCPATLPALVEKRTGEGMLTMAFNQPAGFQTTNPDKKVAYVIIRPRDGLEGAVLAAFPARQGRYIFDVSPERDQLLDAVFGVRGTDAPANQECSPGSSLGESKGYCVLGMAQNQFIPASNEITSEGGSFDDSWKHYLRLAEESAAEADALGQQMIDIGLQRDLRREGAQEELAGICGTFSAAPDLQFDSGTYDIESTENAELNACIHEPLVDIVYLRKIPRLKGTVESPVEAGEDETPWTDDEVAEAAIDAYCENQSGGICDDPDGITISALGLDFPIFTPEEDDPSEYCQDVGSIMNWSTGVPTDAGAKKLTDLGLSDFWSQSSMQALLSRLKFKQNMNGDWELKLGNRLIMFGKRSLPGSAPTVAEGLNSYFEYPTCNNVPSAWCSNAQGGCCSAQGKRFKELFGASLGTSNIDGIRSALESALWLMGGVAGRLPEGVFEMPVPARSYGNGAVSALHPMLVYGKGEFTDVGSNGVFRLAAAASHFPGDISALGDLKRGSDIAGYVNSRKSQPTGGRSYASGVFDLQLDNIYAATAKNAPVNFGPPRQVDWLQTITSKSLWETYPSFVQAGNQACDLTGNGFSFFRHNRLYSRICPVVEEDKASCDDSFCIEEVLPEHEGIKPNYGLINLHFPSINSDLDPDNPGTPASRRCTDETISVACAAVTGYQGSGRARTVYKYGHGPADGRWDRLCSEFSADILAPSWCGPDKRLHLFLPTPPVTISGYSPPDPSEPGNLAYDVQSSDAVENFPGTGNVTPMHAARAFMASLTCAVDGASSTLEVTFPPPIKTRDDVEAMRIWVQGEAEALAKAVDQIFFVGVPQRAVDFINTGELPYGAISQGQRGDQVLSMAQGLVDVAEGVRAMAATVREMSRLIDSVQAALDTQDAFANTALAEISLRQFEAERQQIRAVAGIVQGVAQAVAGMFPPNASNIAGGFASATNSALDLEAAIGRKDRLGDIEGLKEQEGAAQTAETLVNFVSQMADAREKLQSANNQVKTAVVQILRIQNTMAQSQLRAASQAAKAAGADYFVPPGKTEPVLLPVNTVYRRQYDVTARRYKIALQSAKRYAYLARLAIEQRLGVRLDHIDESVGPIEAPSLWVDDICSLQGVDYESLRQFDADADLNGGAAVISEEDVVAGFADQYVGDYVNKLAEFVEFYVLQSPFQEADDLAVVSLADDLLPRDRLCNRESINELYFSDSLEQFVSDEKSGISKGWQTGPCLAAGCPVAQEPYYLSGGNRVTIPSPTTVGRASLFTVPRRLDLAGNPTPVDALEQQGTGVPGSVYQTSYFESDKAYQLSYWAMARAASGAVSASAVSLDVTVRTETGTLVAYQGVVLPATTNDEDWGSQRGFEVQVPESGYYRVGFELTAANVGVAIANVQLAEGQEATTLGYEPTNDVRESHGVGCPAAGALQDAFNYHCSREGVCYWELKSPVVLEAAGLSNPLTSLPGVPAENYNYRHGTVAVNLVGTGLRDCAGQGSGCYSKGYVEYDLDHTAFDVGIEAYDRNVECFSFGRGRITRAKALATERVLGIPLGSADAGLIDAPEFSKRLLIGRPLSGTYQLRIYDEPGFQFDQLEDVQIVLRHRHWTRADRAPDSDWF